MLVSASRPTYASGDCEVDLHRRELRVPGTPEPLGSRAFEIIATLAEAGGELVTKDELMDRIWPGAMAHDQQALYWELCAAMSLAELLRGQHREAEARAVLEPVYGRFTEGFAAPKMQQAKALLDQFA